MTREGRAQEGEARKDAAKDVAEDVLGAAEDGSPSVSGGKIITTPVAYPQLPPTPKPQKVSSSTISSSSRQALFAPPSVTLAKRFLNI